jgi:hypothetical protein
MAGIWKFLQKEPNRKVLSWLGGGIVVVASAAWAVYTFVAEPKPAAKATSGGVSAACGSVAVGGSADGAKIAVNSQGPCPPK